MKYIASLLVCGSMLLASHSAQAESTALNGRTAALKLPKALQRPRPPEVHYGNSTFSADPTLWYTITTSGFPTTVPLSQNRNSGAKKGEVYLSPTGFTVGESGNYWVSISAIMQNPNTDTILIPVFLVRDETLDPDHPEFGGVLTLEANEINTLHANGILMNITAGTRLSLVATNAGYPDPTPVTVVGWNISLNKLP